MYDAQRPDHSDFLMQVMVMVMVWCTGRRAGSEKHQLFRCSVAGTFLLLSSRSLTLARTYSTPFMFVFMVSCRLLLLLVWC